MTDARHMIADPRDTLAKVPGPVCVVTAMDGRRAHGTTVSSFTSLSLSPLLVHFSLDRSSDLLALVHRTNRCGVNVLADTQAHIAVAFSRKGADKFDGVAWSDENGLPRIAGAAAWLRCEVDRLVEAGDHVIVIAAVAGAQHAPLRALAYLEREFARLVPTKAR